MFDGEQTRVLALAAALNARGFTCCTAESCTGGLIGATLTSVPGSSGWFAGGVISYANGVKQGILGVSAQDLNRFGAVSEAVVQAMALGACRCTGADAAMAVSGVAGPDGGSPGKPVGTVWIAVAVRGKTEARCFHFTGNRHAVRLQTVQNAIDMLTAALNPSFQQHC